MSISRRTTPVNGNYAVDHSNVIYLMGPDGKFIANYNETMGPDGLAAAIENAIWRLSGLRFGNVDAGLRAGRDQRVPHQADDGHRADAAGHRRDGAGNLCRRVVIDIADDLVFAVAGRRRG